jgi:hypothetical protein
MTSKDEFAGLFATYFGDKLSPAQIEAMAVDVVAAQADRRARRDARSCAPGPQRGQGAD